MIPTLLLLRHKDAAPQVYRYLNTVPTPLGNTFGADDSPATPEYWTRRNAVIQAAGSVFAIMADGVYRLQPDGVTWSMAGVDGGLTFTNPSLAAGFGATRSGLHGVYLGVTPYIFGWYKSTTGGDSLRGFRLNLISGAWAEQADASTGVIVSATDGGSPHNEVVFRGRLYFGTAAAGGVVSQRVFNPENGAFAVLTHPISEAAGLNYVYDYCAFNNSLYLLTPIDVGSGANGRPRLYTLDGTSWSNSPVELDTASADLGATDGGVCRWCLFTDGTYLYALCLVNTDGVSVNYGWRCYRISDSFVVTDISTDVLPVELLSPDDGGVAPVPTTGRFFKFVDVDTDPAVPTIWLTYSPNNDPSEQFSFYEWIDDSTTIQLAGTDGNAADAAPHLSQTGGSRIYTPGELEVLVTNRQPIVGGERLFFRAWGSPGPANKVVRFYFNTQGEPITVQCTLEGTVTGGSASRAGNAVVDVEADDGATEYSVAWAFEDDGVSAGARVQIMPRISLS